MLYLLHVKVLNQGLATGKDWLLGRITQSIPFLFQLSLFLTLKVFFKFLKKDEIIFGDGGEAT